MFKVCPICQQQVAVYEWAVHEMQHRGAMQSPRQVSHSPAATIPLQQAAAKAPRIYHHPRCGHATALPEAAVYAQIQDPFCGSDQAYCSGCKGYVATSELFWEGTSESLLSTDRRRKADYIRTHGLNPNDFVWDSTGPVARKSQSSWGVMVGVGVGAVALVFLLGVGLVIAIAIGSHQNRAAAPAPIVPPVQPAVVPMVPQPVGGIPIIRANPLDDVRIRQDDVFAEMRKQQEKLRQEIQQMRPPDFPAPPVFAPPSVPIVGAPAPSSSTADPGADARRSIEEMRRESERRIEEMRERSRIRREEAQKRMNDLRSRFP